MPVHIAPMIIPAEECTYDRGEQSDDRPQDAEDEPDRAANYSEDGSNQSAGYSHPDREGEDDDDDK